MLANQSRRFGETLVDRHVLSRDDLEHAISEADRSHQPLPSVLLRMGLVGSKDLTAALAEEVAKAGILVNAVAPSIMDTPPNRQAMPKADYGLWPKVEEVAATIAFLASPENLVTRGAIVPVYGKS